MPPLSPSPSPARSPSPKSAAPVSPRGGNGGDVSGDGGSERRSSPPQPSSPLPRSRSVQFTGSPSPTSPTSPSLSGSRSQEQRHHRSSFQQQAGESSADEITPMISRERGGAPPKGYDTTTVPPPSESAQGPAAEATAAAAGTSGRSGRVDAKRRGNRGSRARRGGSQAGRHRTETSGTSETPEEEEEEEGEVGGWWKNFVENFGSVELENKGSVARDHLALERTFLAWLRTSLAFASIGIAVTQLFRLNTAISQREGQVPDKPASKEIHLRQLGKPLGSIFLGVAIVVLIVGGRRYFEGQYWIIRGKFPASRGSVFLISFITGALIVSSLVVVLVITPTALRKR